MRIRRVIGSVIAAAVAGPALSVVATASPAVAADPVPTRIVSVTGDGQVFSSSSPRLAYGDSISVSVKVEALVDGVWQSVSEGPVTVTEQVVGAAPAVILQGSYARVYDYISARGNAVYTVAYAGGSSSYPAVTYAPTSAAYTVKVERKVDITNISGRAAGFKAKLSPAAKTKVTVFKKVGKRYQKFKTLRTTKAGRAKVLLPAPRRGKIHWKIVFRGNDVFQSTTTKGYTYKRF